MNTLGIGRIERVLLREAWPHEARDFTSWLAENLDLVGDAIGLNLSLIEQEKRAGDFSVDLVAQDGSGGLVVIENQLERSDHDHLGKIITYLAMVGAQRAIWIVPEPRPEHLQAIQWLNENGTASFHLLKLEAIRIAGSPPAPLFTLITGPGEGLLEAGRVKREQQESTNKFIAFWDEFLSYARTKTSLHAGLTRGTANWISAAAGLPRPFGLGYVVSRGSGRVELYIDHNVRGKEYNEAIFNALLARRKEIERTFGDDLEWQELPSARACRICKVFELGIDLDNRATWQPAIDVMVNAMIKLDKAVRPFVKGAMAEAEAEAEARLSQEEPVA